MPKTVPAKEKPAEVGSGLTVSKRTPGRRRSTHINIASIKPKEDILEVNTQLGLLRLGARHSHDSNADSEAELSQPPLSTKEQIDRRYFHREPLRSPKKLKGTWKLWRRRLYVVLWINILMRSRGWSYTLIEIFFPPLVMFVSLVALTSNFNWRFTGRHTVLLTDRAKEINGSGHRNLWDDFCKNEYVCHKGVRGTSKAYMVYTPETPFTKDLMEGVMANLKLGGDLFSVKNENELVRECRLHYDRSQSHGKIERPYPVGVIFKMSGLDPQDLKQEVPHIFSYTVRTYDQSISNTKEVFPYFSNNEVHDISPYVYEGFLGLQSAIDQNFIKLINQRLGTISARFIRDFGTTTDAFINENLLHQRLKVFPYTLYFDTKIRHYTWFLIVFTVYIGYFITTYHRAKQTIMDRQSGILEILKLHGMSNYINLISMLVNDGLLRAFTVGFLTWIIYSTLVKDAAFFSYTNEGLVWFFLLLHGLANSAAIVTICLFFSSPIFGACVTFLLGFLSFIVPMSFFVRKILTSKSTNLLFCILCPHWCLANGLYNFLKFESFEAGLDWTSISTWTDDRHTLFPVLLCCVIFIISTLFYSFLAVYIDTVSEQFLSLREGYCYCFDTKRQHVENESDDDEFEKPVVFEPVVGLPVLLKGRHVTYAYNDFQIALDNVSFDIHEDQITIVLGHSGSGKTTLLQTIAGLKKPVRGYVRIKNIPANDAAENLRHYAGYSPQSHLMYQSLSVQEHIRLCCMLHGREHRVAKREAGALMLRFDLYGLRKVGVKYLNECNLRKLSIAMALSDNPPVLLLDQPTCGMNPVEKRDIWNCIRLLKRGRCVIVTANTMEEADHYGDRIILMAKGKILSMGSPKFLKEKYNTGSYVKLRSRDDSQVDVSGVMVLLKNTTNLLLKPVNMRGFDHQHDTFFPFPKSIPVSTILLALEEARDELGIFKVSVAHVTLASVLHSLSHKAQFEHETTGVFLREAETNLAEDDDGGMAVPMTVPTLPPGILKKPYWCLTMSALFTKQINYRRQRIRTFLLEFCAPLLMMALFVFFGHNHIGVQPNGHRLILSAHTYPRPMFPIWLDVHETNEYRAWEDACNTVSGSTSGRNVFFPATRVGGEQFEDMLRPVIGSRTKFASQVTLGVKRNNEHFIGYYASNALHAAPSTLNYLSNLVLYFMTPDIDLAQHPGRRLNHLRKEYPIQIHTYNHPLPVFESVPIGTVRDSANTAYGVIFGFILALMAATKLGLCLDERVCGLKNLQKISGVSPFQYWTVTFLCDSFVSLIISVLVVAVVLLVDTVAIFRDYDTKLALFLMTVSFLSWASLSYGYALSLILTDKYSAYGQYISLHMLTGMLPELFNNLVLGTLTRNSNVICGFRYGFLIFPAYSINAAFVRIFDQIAERLFCARVPPEAQEICRIYKHIPYDTRSKPIESDGHFKLCCRSYCEGAGTCIQKAKILDIEWAKEDVTIFVCLVSMAVQGILFWVILLLTDYEVIPTLAFKLKNYFTGTLEKLEARTHLVQLDDEVEDEKAIIETSLQSSTPTTDLSVRFLCRGLTKYFGSKIVLNHVYFSLPKGSILGILGEDNSGKTVLLRIITGDLKTSLGTSMIDDLELQETRGKYLAKMAYCPETNPILDHLSGFQMVQFIGRLRGMPNEYLNLHVRQWLILLGFDDRSMQAQCKTYPPGMQRRLCAAMTLIGNSEILIFDDPTDKLDAMEHLDFWEVLEIIRMSGQSIIFTSKSAEECIEVCNKLLLLVGGEIRAIGSPNMIYDKYPKGWVLIIRFCPNTERPGSPEERAVYDMMDQLRDYVINVFSGCQLRETHDNMVIYHLDDPDDKFPLSYMYKALETAKTNLPELVMEYFIEETSLDDVIAHTALYQRRRLSSLASRYEREASEEEEEDEAEADVVANTHTA